MKKSIFIFYISFIVAPCIFAINSPTFINITRVPSATSAFLSWTVENDASNILILRRKAAGTPVEFTEPVNGVAYVGGILNGPYTNGYSWENGGLNATTDYEYKLYSYTDAYVYSAGISVTTNIDTNTNFLSTFATTYGTASSSHNFAVTGSTISTDIVINAPYGFEISTDNTTFYDSRTLVRSGGAVASTTIYCRAKSTAPSGGPYYENISISSTSINGIPTTKYIACSRTGTQKALVITGLSAANKVFNGTNTASLTGTAAYSGLVNSESFAVTGTPTATFDNSTVGVGKSITVTGFTAPSSNYTLTQPTGLTATIFPVISTWSGTNNWSNAANWTYLPLAATEVVVSSGELTINQNATVQSITIQPGAKVTLNSGKVLTITGNFSLQSNALNGTGTFVDKGGTVSVSGTSSIQQYLDAPRNWYLSSPISNALAPSGFVYYKWNEPTEDWSALSIGNPIVAKTGYVIQPSGAATITFSGTSFNTGSQQTNGLTRTTDTTDPGYHLVGNPYPSYIDWEAASTTKTNLSSTIWYRTNKSLVYYFETYNAAGHIGTNASGNGTVTRYIPPMQSFWVKVESGTGSLGFTNAGRSHESGTNRLKAPSVKNENQKILRIQVSNGQNMDETILYADDNASNNFDTYDSQKKTNRNKSVPEIYSLQENEKLVINGLNSFQPLKIYPLGFTTGETNEFSLQVTELSNFDSDTRICLRDELEKTEFDLTSFLPYHFSSNKITDSDRFSIIFKSASGTTDFKYKPAERNVYSYTNAQQQLVVNYSSSFSSAVELKVYNTQGQKIISKELLTNTTTLDTKFIPGVYLISVSEAGKSVTSKFVMY